MINSNIYFNENDYIIGFEIEGHSDYEIKGKDIICSGVSAITQAGLIGLQKLTNIKISVDKRNGYLKVILNYDIDNIDLIKSQAILYTVYYALEDISKKYSEYIKFNKIILVKV